MAEREDFGEPVRDVDDRDAAFGELAHHLEQLLGFGEREGRGRFVEDEDAQVARQRLGDLDDLRLRGREGGDLERPDRWRRRASAISFAARSRMARLSTWPSQRGRLPAGEDVLRHGELRHQRAFLMDDADAEIAQPRASSMSPTSAPSMHARRRCCAE